MGLSTMLKARKAVKEQNEGHVQEAMQLYSEAIEEGLQDVKFILAYSVLLLRSGDYAKARELLVKIQKYPMTADQKTQLFVNYATCVYKMGDIEKGIALLERQHEKAPCGLVYETLGYLYIEAGERDKAIAFNTESYEYDDEDSITLDNLGQTYYRLDHDKAAAKEYFDKAYALKPNQMDTLYFLAQYDLDAGDKAAAKEKLESILDRRYSPLNFVTKEKVEELLHQC